MGDYNWLQLLEILGLLSVLMFVGSLAALPVLVNRLSVDYFVRHRKGRPSPEARNPTLALLYYVFRNVFGSGLVLAGIVMLVLPGQGILTILIGICVMDFPGKHTLIERAVRFERVRNSLNWMRKKGGKPAFLFLPTG